MTTLRYSTAPLKRRLAALLYELLLVAAVSAAAAIPAGITAMLLNRFSPRAATLAVSLMLMFAWWLYFRSNWLKKGQTLPMRVWKIGLANQHGSRPAARQLGLRFMWACVFLVLIPLLAYAALHHNGIPPRSAFGASLCWWILPWGYALLNQDGQFLYDILAGTRLVDLLQKQ